MPNVKAVPIHDCMMYLTTRQISAGTKLDLQESPALHLGGRPPNALMFVGAAGGRFIATKNIAAYEEIVWSGEQV